MKKMKNVKRSNRLIALLLALVLSLSMGTTVFAAEPNVAPEEAMVEKEAVGLAQNAAMASARSIYGYAASYTNSSMDSFYVNATGSSSGSGGFTIESYSFPSNTVKIAITLYRPDGTKALNASLTGNQKIENLSFSNAMPGNYRVNYVVYGSSKGWLGAWVY